MVKVVAKFHLQEKKEQEFIELVKDLIDMSRKEEGCLSYELFQEEKDPQILTMIEEWESEEVLNNHFLSEHFLKIVPLIKGLLLKPGEINIYRKLI